MPKEFDERFDFDDFIKSVRETSLLVYVIKYPNEYFNGPVDYKKAFNKLMELGPSLEDIYQAGLGWSEFDYKKGLKILKERTEKRGGEIIYRAALQNWPKSPEEIKKQSNEIKKSPMLPTKKLKLEEYKPRKRKFGKQETVEIWENPTSSEMHEALQEYETVRYAVLINQKKVIMFDAQYLHADILAGFYNIRDYHTNKNILTGSYNKNRVKVSVMIEQVNDLLGKNFDWVDKYIPGFAQELKESVNRYKKMTEEYKPAKVSSATVEIWENPTVEELNTAHKQYSGFRFAVIIDKKKVLIWNSEDAWHGELLSQLFNITHYSTDPNIVVGFFDSDNTEVELTVAARNENYFERDLNWIEKYIPDFNHAFDKLKRDSSRNWSKKKKEVSWNNWMEEFKPIKDNGDIVDIWVWENSNPSAYSKSELRDAFNLKEYEYSRIAINTEKKEIIVFSPNALHEVMSRKFWGKDYFTDGNVLAAQAKMTGDGLMFASVQIETFERHYKHNVVFFQTLKELYEKNYEWVDKFIPGFNNWISKRKKEFYEKLNATKKSN
jgi:hypothetical protein